MMQLTHMILGENEVLQNSSVMVISLWGEMETSYYEDRRNVFYYCKTMGII